MTGDQRGDCPTWRCDGTMYVAATETTLGGRQLEYASCDRCRRIVRVEIPLDNLTLDL